MIEKILERLEEEALQAEKDMGLSDTFAEVERCGGRWAAYEKSIKIVQEVAKEFVTDTNVGHKLDEAEEGK